MQTSKQTTRALSQLGAAAALVLGLAAAQPAQAIDTIAFELGTGDDGADRVGLAVQWDWNKRWFDTGDWYLGGYWEVSASYWDADDGRTGTDSLVEAGAAPVFRFQRDAATANVAPFIELGVGVHLMSETELEDRDFDINFAFGSHLGAGLRFGTRNQYEISYRYQHLSNASIGDSNPGIDFHILRLGYRF